MADISVVTDSLGRNIEVKALGVSDQFDLLEASQNQAEYKRWFGLATLVFSCLSIDGVPLPAPKKPADFKKNAAALKDEGIKAVADHFAAETDADEDGQAQVETAKN